MCVTRRPANCIAGGCCPVGYVCGPTDCSAPVGVKNTITSCPASYYLCPAEMNFGCCQTGMGCAPNACYSTAPVPTTIIQRITTTSDGETITSTRTTITTTTPTAPPRLVAQDPNVAAKFIPSTLPKTSASPPPSAATGGLTPSQLGGIIGGAVALLLVVLVAAFIILKRLNRIHHSLASPSEKSRSSHVPGAAAAHQQYSHVSHDDTSVDPLMQQTTPNIGGSTPGLRSRSASNQFSPTFDATKTPRQVSVDSAAGAGAAGYFDLPPRVHNVPGVRDRGRSSVDSYAPHPYHQRHQSNASDVSDGIGSGGVTSPLVVQELDSAGYVELPSGGGFEEIGGGYRSRANSGGGSLVSPRGSFQIGGNGGGRDVSPGFVMVGSPPLDVVNEHSEIMTGYYGPRDRQVGQTAAGLEVGMDVSSPGGEGFSREVGGVLHPPREGEEEGK